jgi:hypothetical protein
LATVDTEVRQAFAIAPSLCSGVRLTSNSIRAVRRSSARTATGLSLAADSIPASAARSRLQSRQYRPSAELAQVLGNGIGSPSMRLTETPHWVHVHFLAFFGSFDRMVFEPRARQIAPSPS